MKKFLLALIFLVSVFAVGTACGDKKEGKEDSSIGATLQTMDISLNSKTFDYDGQEHSLTIEGELPENAVVVWQNNRLKDVGENTVFVSVKCAGYKEVSLKATLTVLGRDFPDGVALEAETVSVHYGDEYSFALKDEGALPADCVLTEKYIDMQSGEEVDGKPTFGGDFKYVLQVSAPGYNAKLLYGTLSISRPDAESVEIVNLPSVPVTKYMGKAALLPGVKWTPQVEILPKGHKEVELEYTTDNDLICFENGAFVAAETAGNCKITVTLKGTDVSKTYTVTVADCDFYYEDFEDDGKTLYQQQFVMVENEQGQLVPKLDENGAGIIIPKDESTDYYGAFSAVGTNSEILTQNGNGALHVTGAENFAVYYSYFEIDATPTGGWKAGTYRVEMEVTGDYAFTFWWIRNASDGANYYLIPDSGALSNGEAVIENGKIVIEFTLTADSLGDTNVIRFAQSSRNGFEFTVDNIMIVKTL